MDARRAYEVRLRPHRPRPTGLGIAAAVVAVLAVAPAFIRAAQMFSSGQRFDAMFVWNVRNAPGTWWSIACLATAGLATSALAMAAALRRVRIGLRLPRTAFAGRTLPLELSVGQVAPWPVIDVTLRVDVGAASTQVRIPYIGPSRGVDLELSALLPAQSRGTHGLARITVTSAPFGLVEAYASADVAVDLTVFPEVEVLERTPVAPGSPLTLTGEDPLLRPGHDPEFLGVRPYALGDSMRLVHWKATARRGTLVVREQARLSTADVMIALDPGGAPAAALEDLVVTAASVALHLHLGSVRCGLTLGTDPPAVVPLGAGANHHNDIQAVLAHAHAASSSRLVPVLRLALGQVSAGCVLVGIAMRPAFNREARAVVDEARAAQVRPMMVLLVPERYASGSGAETDGVAPPAASPLRSLQDETPVIVPGRPLRLAPVLRRIG